METMLFSTHSLGPAGALAVQMCSMLCSMLLRFDFWNCSLQDDEQNLKKHIKALENSIKDMTEDAANSARLYVTDEDIAKLPCTANDTVFAVKAPQGTTLEVPDPDDGLETGQRRYRWSFHLLSAPCDSDRLYIPRSGLWPP